MRSIAIPLTLIFFCISSGWAQGKGWPTGEEPTFGGEFTFARAGMNVADHRPDLDEIRSAYKKFCAGGSCKLEGDKVINPETGFWVKIGNDIGCLEFGMKPSTVADMELNVQWLQKHLFDFVQDPAGLNYQAALSGGGGHVSMDKVKAFGQNPLAIFNAYVSFANFPILPEYIFGLRNNWNARPVSGLPDSARERVIQVLRTFTERPRWEAEELIKLLNEAQQSAGGGTATNNEKSHAMSIKSEVFEFRGHLPQLSAFQFLDQIMLYRDWALWVNSQGDFLKEAIPRQVPNLTPQEVRQEFTRFLDMIGRNTPRFQGIYVMDLGNCPAVEQAFQSQNTLQVTN